MAYPYTGNGWHWYGEWDWHYRKQWILVSMILYFLFSPCTGPDPVQFEYAIRTGVLRTIDADVNSTTTFSISYENNNFFHYFLQETRWNAITMPGCHGKWMLKTEHGDCTCDPNSEMSFILL